MVIFGGAVLTLPFWKCSVQEKDRQEKEGCSKVQQENIWINLKTGLCWEFKQHRNYIDKSRNLCGVSPRKGGDTILTSPEEQLA